MFNFLKNPFIENITDTRSHRDQMTALLFNLKNQSEKMLELKESGKDYQENGERVDSLVDHGLRLTVMLFFDFIFLKIKSCRYSYRRFLKFLAQKSEELKRKGDKSKKLHDLKWKDIWFLRRRNKNE